MYGFLIYGPAPRFCISLDRSVAEKPVKILFHNHIQHHQIDSVIGQIVQSVSPMDSRMYLIPETGQHIHRNLALLFDIIDNQNGLRSVIVDLWIGIIGHPFMSYRQIDNKLGAFAHLGKDVVITL